MQFLSHRNTEGNARPAGSRSDKVVLLRLAYQQAKKAMADPFSSTGEVILSFLEERGAHLVLPPMNDHQPYLHAGELLVWSDAHNDHVMVTMPDGSVIAGEPPEVEEFIGALVAALYQLRKS